MALGAALITFGALVALAVPQVTQAQERRTDLLTPRIDLSERSQNQPGLRTFDPNVDLGRRWEGHQITRTYFAGNGDVSDLGLRKLPARGTVAVSPALKRLIQSNDIVADIYRGKRISATIRDVGLVEPHELRSVEQVASGLPLQYPVDGFGITAGPNQVFDDGNGRLNAVVALIAAVTIVLPSALLLWIVTRLSAPSRRKTSIVLHRVGLSRRSTWTIAAMAGGLISVPASVVGCVLFNIVVNRVTAIPGSNFGFFADDVSLPAWKQTIATIAVSLLTVCAFAFASKEMGPRRPRRRWLPMGLRVAVLTTGIALLCATSLLVRAVGPNVGFTIWAGIGLTGLGFVLVAPAVVRMVSDAWAKRARSAGTLVGSKLMVTHRSALDVGSLLGVCVILYLGSLSFMSILQGGNSDDWNARISRQSHIPFTVNDLADQLTRGRILKTVPTAKLVSLSESKGGFPVVYGSCADVEGISSNELVGCTGHPQQIVIGDQPAEKVPDSLTLGDGTKVSEVGVLRPLHARNVPQEFHGAILVGAEHAPPAGAELSSTFYVVVRSPQLVASMARIGSVTPLPQFDLGPLDYHNPATTRFPKQLACIGLAASIGLVIGALGVAGLIAAEARRRSRQLRGLRILGSPRSQLLLAHSIATVGAFVCLGLASLMLGALVAWTFTSIDGRAYVSARPYIAIVAALLGLSSLVVWATWRDAQRSIGRSSGIVA
ncbi:FtsX-like permease family protein [Aeromicrobium sp. Root344]|uniref:FtsX-like permease family protein n=1 Tax=Aeromicrobium sp. Root344 TaxID=1736521 RepID=UPI00138EFA1F|nr:FtsX-like permease family protein [Aeromicrobium sp. Root344]